MAITEIALCSACLRGHHPEEGFVLHLQCWSQTALICGAVMVPEVQVNQSSGLNTEPHEHVVLKTCLLAIPSSGMSCYFCHTDMLEFSGIICCLAQVTNLGGKKQ